MKLDKARTLRIIRAALKEDIGVGDVTTTNVINKFESIKASIVTNEDCILCGIDVAEWTVNAVDFSVRFKPQAEDGQRVYQGKEIAFLEGRARAILSAERTILNFLGFLSGIATNVNKYVEKVKKYDAKIYDTRKTFPLLRYLEKHAVVVGGGHNHRFGLWDQALVKDNHLKIRKDILHKKGSISEIKKNLGKRIKIETEVGNLEEYKAMLDESPDIIMLDNMPVDDVAKAVSLRNKTAKKAILEVSGSIHLDNVEEYAKTGVDRIAAGSLTDSIQSIDMSLEVTG